MAGTWALAEGRSVQKVPQAWLYGPVFRSLYQAVKQWGRRSHPTADSSALGH